MSDDYRQLLRGEIDADEYVSRLKADVDGRSAAGSPAHRSGSESPDPSPDCPRCAALTRDLAQARQALRGADFLLDTIREAIARRPDPRAAITLELTPQFEALALEALVAAREALVERGTSEQEDLGGEQGSPSAGEQA